MGFECEDDGRHYRATTSSNTLFLQCLLAVGLLACRVHGQVDPHTLALRDVAGPSTTTSFVLDSFLNKVNANCQDGLRALSTCPTNEVPWKTRNDAAESLADCMTASWVHPSSVLSIPLIAHLYRSDLTWGLDQLQGLLLVQRSLGPGPPL
jgi:hypothetical protein